MAVKSIDSRPAGMGDLMVGLWIAEAARLRGERIVIVEEHRRAIAESFGFPPVSEATEESMLLGSGSRVYDEELHSAEHDRSRRTDRWPITMGWEPGGKRPRFRALSQDAIGWANSMTEGGRPTVVIAPKAAFSPRTMPIQKWLRIAWSLHAAGVRTIAIDGDKEAIEAFPFYAYGFDWHHTMALLSRATIVAANDSGIAHLAATIGVPTIAAMGPTDSNVVFGHCLDVLTPIVATTVDCVGCHFSGSRGFQSACDQGCEALQAIPWQMIRDLLMEAVEREQMVLA